MIIDGANLGKKEVEYKLLSQYRYFNDGKQELVKKLEQLYFNFMEESKKSEIAPLPLKDGKVMIQPGMVYHSCTDSLEILRTISEYGILASEWFGKIESEREGIFCAFTCRIHNELDPDNSRQYYAKMLNNRRLTSKSVKLFFDSTNPIMEKLLHLDYFEFEKVKQQTPEKLNELYSKEEIELLETIIEPYSLRGRSFHIKKLLPYCDWSAIPGGIPSGLVNGICINRDNYDKDEISEIAKLFPNATIFNGELVIIYTPEREKEDFLKRIKLRPEELNNQQDSINEDQMPTECIQDPETDKI